MKEYVVHSFEAGRRGKPDELDSGIAHLIGAYLLERNPLARFDLRVQGSYLPHQNLPSVRISGEVTGSLLDKVGFYGEIIEIITDHYNEVHQSDLSSDDLHVEFQLKPQSSLLADNEYAGDSGNPIAVAYKHGPQYLPWERYLAVELRDLFDGIYHQGGHLSFPLANHVEFDYLEGLLADGKIAVDCLYHGVSLQSVERITVALQHQQNLPLQELRTKGNKIIRARLGQLEQQFQQPLGHPEIIINGNGAWHDGGWKVDEGSREAKSYRDGFSTYGVMEDSFSGEDPSKPSGTGTFLARYIAVQIVGNDAADFARVALRYTIGTQEVGLNIWTNNTGRQPQQKLEEEIREKIPLKIKGAAALFNLGNPALYREIVANSDFFHNPELPWNKFEVKCQKL